MRGAFVQVKQFVEERFPGTIVLGSTFPVASYKVFMSKAVTAGQIALAAIMLAGDQIFQMLGVPPPQLYLQLREKKMGILVGIWFIGNMLHNSLMSTGAFEVFSNGEQVFSKLETNRMPSIEELVHGLERTLSAAGVRNVS